MRFRWVSSSWALNGAVSKINWDCKGEMGVVANWILSANVDMKEADAIRIVLTGLQVMANKSVRGLCDVDIMDIVFGLMRKVVATLD